MNTFQVRPFLNHSVILLSVLGCDVHSSKEEHDYSINQMRKDFEKEFDCLGSNALPQDRLKKFETCLETKLPKLKERLSKQLGQTQCGEITGALKIGSEFHPFDYRHQHAVDYTRETRDIETYLMQYKPKESDSISESDPHRYFYITFPRKHDDAEDTEKKSDTHPVLLWGHGLGQENWNKMDNYLTFVPTEAIILKPIFKSELPQNEQLESIREANHDIPGTHQFGDALSLLSATDCLMQLNEMKKIPIMKPNLESAGQKKNPFHRAMRIVEYPQHEHKQVETHYFGNSLGALNGLKMLGSRGLLNKMSEDKNAKIDPFYFASAFIATPQASFIFDDLAEFIWDKAEEYEQSGSTPALGILTTLASFLLSQVKLVKEGKVTSDEVILNLMQTDAATNLNLSPFSFPKKETEAKQKHCNMNVLYSKFDSFSNLNTDLPGLEKDESLKALLTYIQSKFSPPEEGKKAPSLLGTLKKSIRKWKKPDKKTEEDETQSVTKQLRFEDLVANLSLPHCSGGKVVVTQFEPTFMASTSLINWIEQAALTNGMTAYEGDAKFEIESMLSHVSLFPYRGGFFSSPHIWDMGTVSQLSINGQTAHTLADGFKSALDVHFHSFDTEKIKYLPGKKLIAAAHDFFTPHNNQHLKYPVGYLYEWLTENMHIPRHVPQTWSITIAAKRILLWPSTEKKNLCRFHGWAGEMLEQSLGKEAVAPVRNMCVK
jgi:hypothetical protein